MSCLRNCDDIENFENGQWTSQWHFRSRLLIGEGFIFYSRERERSRVSACPCTVVVMPCTRYGLTEKKEMWIHFRALRGKKKTKEIWYEIMNRDCITRAILWCSSFSRQTDGLQAQELSSVRDKQGTIPSEHTEREREREVLVCQHDLSKYILKIPKGSSF